MIKLKLRIWTHNERKAVVFGQTSIETPNICMLL
jgi:hypothetical protein